MSIEPSDSDKRRRSAIGAKDKEPPTHRSNSNKASKSQSQSNSSAVKMSTIGKEEGKRVFGKIKKEGLVKGSRFGIQI